MQPTLEVKLAHCSYPIFIRSGILDHVSALLPDDAQRCAVISDETVNNLYGRELLAELSKRGFAPFSMEHVPGEQAKSMRQYEEFLQAMLAFGADRKTLVLALGGGVVGDLAGFVAATYMRGIRLIQIPTTLLGQVDSSVGGKVGINLPGAKNSVGAFWQPTAVIIDPLVLETLDTKNYTSGLAEVVKYAAIMDVEFFDFLCANAEPINNRNSTILEFVITKCCQLKASVVQEDEREMTGHRAILNFGHTFAHAIESCFGYGAVPHGHAVAMGMHAAAHLAVALQRVDQGYVSSIVSLLDALNIPMRFPAQRHTEMLQAMKRDKKSVGGDVAFVLPTRLGQVELVSSIDPSKILKSMQAAGQV